MSKRITVDDLRVGMYVTKVCGSWIDHPFWRRRFRIESDDELSRLRTSGVREVWIDAARGPDLAPAAPTVGPVAAPGAAPDRGLPSAEIDGDRVAARQPLAAELEQAARICRRAKPAVASLFQQARLGKAIDAEAAQPLVDEISDSVARNPEALISLARLKTADEYTFMHSVAVCALMVALGRQLGLDESQTRQAGLAGLLHDLGKALVPLAILNKPGTLTDSEFARIKRHPDLGHQLLTEGRGAPPPVLDVCLHHHERIDGSGYPHGLIADQISLFAKMGAVCDVYDAITSDRPYKRGWDPAESIRKMAQWRPAHFDERVFHAFVKSVGIYPVGSLVRMASGRLGVVVEQSGAALTAPCVKLFFSTHSNTHIEPVLLDLSRSGVGDRIVEREDPDRWRFAHLDTLWAGAAATGRRT